MISHDFILKNYLIRITPQSRALSCYHRSHVCPNIYHMISFKELFHKENTSLMHELLSCYHRSYACRNMSHDFTCTHESKVNRQNIQFTLAHGETASWTIIQHQAPYLQRDIYIYKNRNVCPSVCLSITFGGGDGEGDREGGQEGGDNGEGGGLYV